MSILRLKVVEIYRLTGVKAGRVEIEKFEKEEDVSNLISFLNRLTDLNEHFTKSCKLVSFNVATSKHKF